MSFIEELKTELVQERQNPPLADRPVLNKERFEEYIREELFFLQQKIKRDARAGKYESAGEKHIFKGIRLWHEGDYRHGTNSLATFYSFLARDTILSRTVLHQRKKLLGGYSYEVRYSLTKEGGAYFERFAQRFAEERIKVEGLFAWVDNKSTAPLPYLDRGDVKYDFELEHHLINYPKLCYTYELEL